jgi:lipoprotein-anchoring transpeptidase ErfK/SrfK
LVSTIGSGKEHTSRERIRLDAPETTSAIADITQHEARDLYLDGVTAALRKKRSAAEHLLRASLALDPLNAQAWLWLAGVVDKPEETIHYLEQVLALVPNESHALEGIQWARLRQAQETPVSEAPTSFEHVPPHAETTQVRTQEENASASPVWTKSARNRSRIWRLVVICGLFVLGLTFATSHTGFRSSFSPRKDRPNVNFVPVVVGTDSSAATIESSPSALTREIESVPPTLLPDVLVTPTVVLPATLPEFIPPTGPPLSAHFPLNATSPAVIPPSPTPKTAAEIPAFRPNWYPAVSPLSALRFSTGKVSDKAWNLEKGTTGRVDPIPIRQGKWIDIDISEQTLRAFEDGHLMMEVKVSTGPKQMPTVQGEYRILSKYRAIDMSGPGYYVSAVPHAMFFYQGYSIHGAYWHNKFGQPTGHGCVNMKLEDAKKLFEWADPPLPKNVNSVRATKSKPGTVVVVHK